MIQLERDMSNASALLQRGGPVYTMSNENVPEYLLQFGNLRDKEILTVAASGDHAFQAYFMGAKNVDTFDANIWQQAVMNLKLHMIRELSYTDFMNFFINRGDKYNFDTIRPLFDKLPYNTRRLIAMYKTMGRMSVMQSDYNDYSKPSGYYYANRENYETLQQALPDSINFIHTDVNNLGRHINKKYDIIMLSNIFSYWSGAHQTGTTLMRMYDQVLRPLADNNLNPDGQICVHYNWGYDYGIYPTERWCGILEQLNETTNKNGHNFDFCFVDSLRERTFTDLVTIMSKRGQRSK